MSIGHNSTQSSGERLRSFVERIERLETEKAGIQSDIAEIKTEAKHAGFDIKTINKILKERKLTPQQIEEEQALLDIYRATLGMLHDTPLGEAARRRLGGKPPECAPDNPGNERFDAPEIDTRSIEEARDEGREAAEQGIPVTDNPFPARDPRRAAWDEAWCAAAGSDGMEIPEAFRRTKPGKPAPETAAPDTPEDETDPGADEQGNDEQAADDSPVENLPTPKKARVKAKIKKPRGRKAGGGKNR